MQDRCTRPICTEWWCTEANEATQTHCYNPVAPAYPIWAYYAHGRQRRCQEDPVSNPSGRLEKTTKSSPHHVAQHHPTGSETSPPYAPRSSRFGSEPPSVEDYVDVWRYAIVSCMPETTTTTTQLLLLWSRLAPASTISQSPSTDVSRVHCTTFGTRVFVFACTTAWNSLPDIQLLCQTSFDGI